VTSSSEAFEAEVLALVNDRRAVGAVCGGTPYAATAPLDFNPLLRDAARAHSLDMGLNAYFSHTSLDGRTVADRISATGYSGSYPWGENIAAGYFTPDEAVQAWMASPGHCSGIMRPDFRVVGIGHGYVEGSPYLHYWTMNFGGS
jgi:uncharacterized protein YkwD